MSKKLIQQRFAFAADNTTTTDAVTAFPCLPASPFKTQAHDARRDISFEYDAQEVIANFERRKKKLPFTIEHNDVTHEDDTRARGWVAGLTAEGTEPGVLYANVELNELGTQEHQSKFYGFTSAVADGYWIDEVTFHITKVRSLTMTNDPATEMPMNFTAEADEDGTEETAQEGTTEGAGAASTEAGYTEQDQPNETPQMLTKILEKLGLAADANEESVLAAIDAALTVKTSEAETALTAVGFTAADVPTLVRSVELETVRGEVTTLTARAEKAEADVATLTASLDAAKTNLETLQKAQDEAQLSALVDGYIRDQKITPAQRDTALAMARVSRDAFAQFAASLSPVVTAPAAGPAGSSLSLSAEEIATAKSLGISPETFAKSRDEARSRVGI